MPTFAIAKQRVMISDRLISSNTTKQSTTIQEQKNTRLTTSYNAITRRRQSKTENDRKMADIVRPKPRDSSKLSVLYAQNNRSQRSIGVQQANDKLVHITLPV